MDDPITFDSIDVSLSANLKNSHPETASDDLPFRILIMGDFSGRFNRGVETDGSDIGTRRLHRVDRDNDDAVMKTLGSALRISVGGASTPVADLAFSELDDFHPDQIYYRCSLFDTLKKTRRKLLDPDTFADTAAKLSGGDAGHGDRHGGPSQGDTSATPPTDGGLLDQILDSTAGNAARPAEKRADAGIDRFLSDLVSPYLVPDIERKQDDLVDSVDRAIAGLMNTILHDTAFQALESIWRALRFLLRRIDGDAPIQIDLIDLSQKELFADLTGSEELESTALYKKLSTAGQQRAGQVPWSLLVGLYTFEKKRDHVVCLARAGALGQLLNAPFVAGATGSIIGCRKIAATPDPDDWTLPAATEDQNAWRVLRRLPEAGWVGLAMPRFLVRLPYGAASDPVDAFDFEEMPEGSVHDAYLWAHPAFAIAQVLGQTFARKGWQFGGELDNVIAGLPLHLFTSGGERTNKPCCEVLLTDSALGRLIGSGVIPLASPKDQDRAVLVRLQSITDPATPLAGRWR